jgi:hypothetical protein
VNSVEERHAIMVVGRKVCETIFLQQAASACSTATYLTNRIGDEPMLTRLPAHPCRASGVFLRQAGCALPTFLVISSTITAQLHACGPCSGSVVTCIPIESCRLLRIPLTMSSSRESSFYSDDTIASGV